MPSLVKEALLLLGIGIAGLLLLATCTKAGVAKDSGPDGVYTHPKTTSPYHWWSYACCNEKDCRPAKEGEVEETKEGYKVTLPDGTFTIVHWKDTRLKKKPSDNPYAYDGRHHICLFKSAYGESIWHLRCLYPALGAY